MSQKLILTAIVSIVSIVAIVVSGVYTWLLQPHLVQAPELKILGYSSILALTISCIFLFLSPYLPKIINIVNKQKIAYIIFFVSDLVFLVSIEVITFIVDDRIINWLHWLFYLLCFVVFALLFLTEMLKIEKPKLANTLQTVYRVILVINLLVLSSSITL